MSFLAVGDPERVHPLEDLPLPETGDPAPTLAVDRDQTVLTYGLPDGTTARIRFLRPIQHVMGWPNDEVLIAHPLWNKGLRHYGAFEVENSAWKKTIIARNAVHPRASAAHYERLRHFVLTFHDETFECLAEGYVVEVATGAKPV